MHMLPLVYTGPQEFSAHNRGWCSWACDSVAELGRDFSNAYVVFAGLEPDSFKSLFPFWEEQPDVAKINSTVSNQDQVSHKGDVQCASELFAFNQCSVQS